MCKIQSKTESGAVKPLFDRSPPRVYSMRGGSQKSGFAKWVPWRPTGSPSSCFGSGRVGGTPGFHPSFSQSSSPLTCFVEQAFAREY